MCPEWTAPAAYLKPTAYPICFLSIPPAGNESEFHLRIDNYRAGYSAFKSEKDYLKESLSRTWSIAREPRSLTCRTTIRWALINQLEGYRKPWPAMEPIRPH